MSRYALVFTGFQNMLKTPYLKGSVRNAAFISYHKKPLNGHAYLTRYLTRTLTLSLPSGTLQQTLSHTHQDEAHQYLNQST
ncbi:hypothetical protein J6I90_09935 [Pseudidiomarina sp. 1APP75-32.1]|uniref:Uncharacterized protein n=1 Tax=Pseudidiomarina terrestris TaxID=2820060 RepID=A0AAW7R3G7_9GAMM|nr:hypothetical protein [Pseudidiomarina sp. 1APP75-32.1]MDN7125200.1 hypothetical protein [Pseudidiomarina sp. 1APP75-32.1]